MEEEITESSCALGGDGEIREMLLYTVRSLVNHPDDVEIVFISDRTRSVFYIYTHPEDLGELIGNGGQTARALQTIAGASGMKMGRRLTMDIVAKASRSR